MARYIPTDDLARFTAREYVRTQLTAELVRGSLLLTVGELSDDGSCPISLHATPAVWDFRTLLDAPQLDGRAWIDDVSRRAEYDFGAPLQPYTFVETHGR